ncbi:MAG: uroporphyrinogen decarboxylase family protein [Actinobacteria bacterium]|nr:uroporphyrinogen decarboxylase family protein [Actinomycetota bacterium]
MTGKNPERVPIYTEVNYKDGITIPRFGIGSKPSKLKKLDLFMDPELYLNWQLQCINDRMELKLLDDWVPSLFVWYGVCVLSSAFGCSVKFQPSEDPWAHPMLFSAKDVYSLKKPDLRKSGLCKQVLETMQVWQEKTEGKIPIRINNDQSPMDIATQILNFSEFLTGLYEYPKEIHYLLSLVTEAIIEWQEIQAKIIGNQWNGGWQHWTPKGNGALLADDVLVNLSPSSYEEFGVPYISRISKVFGGIFLHYCATFKENPLHNLESLLKIENFKGLETQLLSIKELIRVRDVFNGTAVILCKPPACIDIREHLSVMKGAKHILYLGGDSDFISSPEDLDILREKINVARELLE